MPNAINQREAIQVKGQRTSAVSVIVPALNEEGSIGNLLDALANQTSRPDQVIVVDAGSRDRTRSEAEARSHRFNHFRILDCPGAYPGRARNQGACLAENTHLLFLDCGLSIESDCIERLFTASSESEAVYGWVVPKTDSFFTEYAAIAYLQPVKRGGEPVDRPTVPLLLIERELFQRLDGFPEKLRSAEDLLFLEELTRQGVTMDFVPSALGRWELCMSFPSTFRRFRTYSMHNLKAGLARQWQRPLGLYYATWIAIVSVVLALTSQWLSLPLLLLAFLGLRGAKSLWRHREDIARKPSRRLVQLPMVMAILFVIDLATLSGTVDYLIQRIHSRTQPGFAADEPRSKDA